MSKSTTTIRRDVYSEITAKILTDLEQGVRPWIKPWSVAGCAQRPLRSNGVSYQGINVLLLWSAALDRGFSSPTWMTFKQALELGACVRKGETSEHVIYYKTMIKEGEEGTETVIPFARAYSVFNVDQIDGLPERYDVVPEPREAIGERDERLDQWIVDTGAEVRYGGARAFYQPGADFIQMPGFEAFDSSDSYFSTHFHELTHWTKGGGNRLERDFGRKQWGDQGYAREELVAEIGAAFLCADLGVSASVREDHSAYIQSWIQVLKSDSRAIVQAASYATKAVEYLHGLHGQSLTEEESEIQAAA